MLTHISSQIDAIRDKLIARVSEHTPDTPEAEAKLAQWADDFTHYRPEAEQSLEDLKPHVQWPV